MTFFRKAIYGLFIGITAGFAALGFGTTIASLEYFLLAIVWALSLITLAAWRHS